MEQQGNATLHQPSVHSMIFLICGALGLTIVGRSFTALRPGSFDAQLFAYMGLKWLAGHIPYVDIWDHKPPGMFAVNALVFQLFPKSFTALACLEGIFILGCIGTVYLLMCEWRAPYLVAFLATASVAVTSNLAHLNEHGNLAEIYLLWPTTLSMYFFSKAAPIFQGRWVFLAGFSVGVASLFKPTGLSPLVAQGAFMLLLWAVFRCLSFHHLFASMLTSSVGALVAWIPFGVYFWRHGTLRELVDASLIYNIEYGRANWGSARAILFNAASELCIFTSLLISVAILLVLYLLRRNLFASVLTSSIGMLGAAITFGLYFVRRGALRELGDPSFIQNIGYGRANWDSARTILVNAASELYVLSLVISAAVLLLLYVLRCAASTCSPQPEDTMRSAAWYWCPLVLLWVFVDMNGALAGGRNYAHYFLTLAPSLSIALGLAYWFLIDRIPNEGRCSARNAILAVIVGPLILPQLWDMREFRKARPLETWEKVAKQLNVIRTPQDSLFTWDYLPGIYLMTEMKSPTRQLDAHYIFDSVESHRKYGDEILRELRGAPPTFIVDEDNTTGTQSTTYAELIKASDPVYRKFVDLLGNRYVLIYTDENLRLYENRSRLTHFPESPHN